MKTKTKYQIILILLLLLILEYFMGFNSYYDRTKYYGLYSVIISIFFILDKSRVFRYKKIRKHNYSKLNYIMLFSITFSTPIIIALYLLFNNIILSYKPFVFLFVLIIFLFLGVAIYDWKAYSKSFLESKYGVNLDLN